MFHEMRASFGLFVFFFLLTGLAYPLSVYEIGQRLFPYQANGSLIKEDGRVLGSALIAQGFQGNGYFKSRPSAAGTGYDAANSSGSNSGPSSADLVRAVRERIDAISISQNATSVPVDLVTASASGLDPDISVAAARYQAARIADARHLTIVQVDDLIAGKVKNPDFGFLGENRVNVLDLNRALDQLSVMSNP